MHCTTHQGTARHINTLVAGWVQTKGLDMIENNGLYLINIKGDRHRFTQLNEGDIIVILIVARCVARVRYVPHLLHQYVAPVCCTSLLVQRELGVRHGVHIPHLYV